jgi:hypothetical protein
MIEKVVSAIEKLLEDEGKQHNKIQSSGDLDKAKVFLALSMVLLSI